jgi:ribosomal-protein-alanine N-acetyltransferase
MSSPNLTTAARRALGAVGHAQGVAHGAPCPPSLDNPQHTGCHWHPAQAAVLERLLTIEQRAYPWPWSLGNFQDSLRAGYHMPVLLQGPAQAEGVAAGDSTVLGYAVAMLGVQEVHLLNITVDPDHQGRGWGRFIMARLVQWSLAQGAQQLWLEVRQSNARAQALYQRLGFEAVGLRRRYYPATRSQREDAVVMRLLLADRDGRADPGHAVGVQHAAHPKEHGHGLG